MSLRRLLRAPLALAAAAAALLALAVGASAYFTGAGTGSGSATVTSLSAPSISSATFGAAGTVSLRWSAAAGPGSGSVAYYVTRDGGAAAGTCPGSGAPTAATSCTDSGLAAGTHSYTVTAVWRGWTRTSATARVTVSYGVATQLAFTTQPGGGATGGTAFPTQPVVTARDAGGNTVADYAGTVTLSIVSGTGTGGATLSGCAGSLGGGVTTFSGCKIDKAGGAYALGASDGTLSGASTAFDVAVGAAAQLLFTAQPSGATGGSAFTAQPAVTAADAGGNAVTSYAGTVTLSIASGTGTSGATLSGCSRALSRGVTTFTGCKIDKAGSGYRLHASDTRLAADSAAFDVTPGTATRLVFSTQPSGATGGSAFATQPVVTAQDAGGNTATGYAGTVTLAIQSGGAGGATLSGCSGALSRGVTTFAGCKIDKVGANYVLRARDGTLSVDSAAFNVTAGPATRLAFTRQPSGASAGNEFSTQPIVTAFDAGGNVATGYAGTLTTSLVAGSGGGTLGGCSYQLSSGAATFRNCKVNKSGTGYVMRVSDGTLFTDSNPFNVAS